MLDSYGARWAVWLRDYLSALVYRCHVLGNPSASEVHLYNVHVSYLNII